MSAKRSESYVAYRRRSAVRESDLAGLDEDESAAFSSDLIKRFGPYIAPYRGAASCRCEMETRHSKDAAYSTHKLEKYHI
jgi:hypothetical protein